MKWTVHRGHKSRGKVICSKKTCTACGKVAWEPWGDFYNFCPHCGAESDKKRVII